MRAELKARRLAHLQLLNGVVELPAFHLPCMKLIFLLGHQLSEGSDLLLGIFEVPLHTSQCRLLERQRHLVVGQRCERLPKGIFEMCDDILSRLISNLERLQLCFLAVSKSLHHPVFTLQG